MHPRVHRVQVRAVEDQLQHAGLVHFELEGVVLVFVESAHCPVP